MADTKLSALSLVPAAKGDPFNDRFYAYLAEGATDADKQVALRPVDLFLQMNRKWSWRWTDVIEPNAVAQSWSGDGAQGNDQNVDVVNRPGVIAVQCGTDPDGWSMAWSGNNYAFRRGGGAQRFVSVFKTPDTLSTATDRYALYCGLKREYGTAAPGEMIGIRYRDDWNGGKWELVCRDNAAIAAADSGISVTADAWYWVEININAGATSVSVSINGVTVGPVTTQIPLAEHFFCFIDVVKTSGTNNRAAFLDAGGWFLHLATAR